MRQFPVRKWHIYHYNCDCAAYNTARLTPVNGLGPRCIYCHKILGHFEVNKLGEVKARTEHAAFEEFKKKKKEAAK